MKDKLIISEGDKFLKNLYLKYGLKELVFENRKFYFDESVISLIINNPNKEESYYDYLILMEILAEISHLDYEKL